MTLFSYLKMAFIALIILFFIPILKAQTPDTNQVVAVKGQISVTNNGISFIPSFSLGKPAAVLTFSAARRRFSFDPEFRFSLAGKPWSFIFIWRYKLIQRPHFQWSVGAHLPALSFRTVAVVKQNERLDVIQTQRFLSAEVTPTWILSPRVNLGLAYLYGHCLEPDAARNTHFLAFRGAFSGIPITKNVSLKVNPQVFFLKMDAKMGYYATANVSVVPKKWPFSVSFLVNKALQTTIATKPLDWSLSLNYAFSKQYKKS